MFRVLTTIAAVVALAVSAAPASAGIRGDGLPEESLAKAGPPKPRGVSIATAEVFELNTVKRRSAGKSLVWNNGDGND